MRKKPYTEIGIKRIPCKRCGEPSRFQWQVCALYNEYMGVCGPCDVLLNGIVLDFFKIQGRFGLLKDYMKKKGVQFLSTTRAAAFVEIDKTKPQRKGRAE